MNTVKDIVFSKQLLDDIKKEHPEEYNKNFSALIRKLVIEGLKYNNNLALEEGTYKAIKETVSQEIKRSNEEYVKLLFKSAYISTINIQLVLMLINEDNLESLNRDFSTLRSTSLTLLKAKELGNPLLTNYFKLYEN